MVMTVNENHAQQMQSSVQSFMETFLRIQGINFPIAQTEQDLEQKREENQQQNIQQEKENQKIISQYKSEKPDINQKNSQSEKPTTKINNQLKESDLIPLIEIWQKGNLLQGRTKEGKEINNLNPILNGQLEIAHQLGQPGQKIKGLENMEILGIKGDKSLTLFKTDEQGKIEVNSNFFISQQQAEEGAFLKLPKGKSQQKSNIVNHLITDIEAFRAEMKAEIKNEMQEAFKNILKERTQNPSDVNWWQKASQRPGEIWDLWRSKREEQSAAHTVLQLWQKETNRGDKLYQSNGYSVYREGSEFKLEDSKGNELLRFQTNSIGATFVTQSNLTEKDFNALKDLNKFLKTGQLTENFMTVERIAASREIRTFNIVEQLVSLSKQSASKSRKEADENNRYLIRSSSNGEVTIFKKDESEQPNIIFQRTAKGVVNVMTPQDLDHLENVVRVRKQSEQEINNQIQQVRAGSTVRRRGR